MGEGDSGDVRFCSRHKYHEVRQGRENNSDSLWTYANEVRAGVAGEGRWGRHYLLPLMSFFLIIFKLYAPLKDLVPL